MELYQVTTDLILFICSGLKELLLLLLGFVMLKFSTEGGLCWALLVALLPKFWATLASSPPKLP
jgi:hypothetical protein